VVKGPLNVPAAPDEEQLQSKDGRSSVKIGLLAYRATACRGVALGADK